MRFSISHEKKLNHENIELLIISLLTCSKKKLFVLYFSIMSFSQKIGDVHLSHVLFILSQQYSYKLTATYFGPQGGGACDFPNRDNNMCRYYFVGAESRNLF